MLKQGRIYRASVNTLALVLTSDVYGRRTRLIHRALIGLTLASLLVVLPHYVQAQPDDNITTVGSLELVSTFRSVSIYSNFSGDINGNNTAMLQYQKTGETVWRTGPQLVKDMRPSLTFRQGVITNPFYRQWRGSLMFLEPDTEYEVRVTYTDHDGINGSSVVQSTIRTMDENIPAATGSSYYVATDGVDSPGRGSPSRPWATIQYAADQAQAGDTVYIKAGTYYENVNVYHPGEPGEYITFRNYDQDQVVISGRGTYPHSFRLDGVSWIRIKGLTLTDTGQKGSNIYITNSNNIVVEDNHISDGGGGYVGLVQVGDLSIAYPDWDATHTIIIRRNIFSQSQPAREQFAVMVSNTEGHIIMYDNEIQGNGILEDGIGGALNTHWRGGMYRDSDIYNNKVYNTTDDGYELDGPGINVRAWNNHAQGIRRGAFSWAPCSIGPLYIISNTALDSPTYFAKIGGGGWNPYPGYVESRGYVFVFHNSGWRSGGINTTGNSPYYWNQHYFNNLLNTPIKGGDRNGMFGNMFGNNGLHSSATWPKYGMWNGDWISGWGEFTAKFGSTNFFTRDPIFIDPESGDFSLKEGSPGIDRGVIIPGFNDADSPRPYQGLAPDAGILKLPAAPPPLAEPPSPTAPPPSSAPPYTSAPPSPSTLLRRIIVTPAGVNLETQHTEQFSARGYDQYDNEVPISPAWSTDVGSIDSQGLFIAQGSPGAGYVEARDDQVVGQVAVNIVDGPEPSFTINTELARMMAIAGSLGFAITLVIWLRRGRGKGKYRNV